MTTKNKSTVIIRFDPSDWTTEDVAIHLHKDIATLKETIEKAIHNDCTDTLLFEIQSFYGKVRTWLDLYSEVKLRGTEE